MITAEITTNALRAFTASKLTVEALTDTFGEYLTTHKRLKIAKIARERFSAIVNASDGNLPNSMRLKIVKSAQFDTVDDPTFYKDEMAELRKLELTTATQIASTILSAKQRYIEHLAKAASPLTVFTRAAAKFTAVVDAYANAWDEKHRHPEPFDASSALDPETSIPTATYRFPRQSAIEHFERELRIKVDEHTSKEIQEQMSESAAAKLKATEERDAQEAVVSGMGTRESISDIASEASAKQVEKAVEPIKRKVRQLETQQAKAAKSSPPIEHPRPAKKARITIDHVSPSHTARAHSSKKNSRGHVSFPEPRSEYTNRKFYFAPDTVHSSWPPTDRRQRASSTKQHHDNDGDSLMNEGKDSDRHSPTRSSKPSPLHRGSIHFQRGGDPRNTHRRHHPSGRS